MEFGPEIKVDGKRPEWLGGYSGPLGYSRGEDNWYGPCEEDPDFWTEVDILNGRGWDSVRAIRLPAYHSHYATPTPDERAVAPELVERMRKLVETIAENAPWMTTASRNMDEVDSEARAIVAALEPVDPMLLEARQVVADLYTGGNVSHLREQALSGDGDEWFHTKVARAALARGRQLEKEGK